MKNLKPAHLQVVELFWLGHEEKEIAALTGYTPQNVMLILKSEPAKQLLAQLQARAVDTMHDTAQRFQLNASKAADRLISSLNSANENIALRAADSLLDRAGHSPVKKVLSTHQSALEQKYENQSEDEIRARLASKLAPPVGVEPKPLLGPVGPDGRPLN